MSDRAPLRFGVLIPQDAPYAELADRWRRAEELGFDAAYVADHTADWRDLDGHWLDGWTVLAYVTTRTERIRVGTLVSNPLLHHPAQLARQAVAVDQLSGGRLELGIGTSIAGWDHDAVGQPYWSPRERVDRFAEYVEIIDGLLRTRDRSHRYAGRYYQSAGTTTAPGPVQQPRPPLTVGGQSPTVLRVAAQYADCWNTHGPYDRTADEIAEITAAQNERLDQLCRDAGRDPAALRRSLLLFGALDAWVAEDSLATVVHQFRQAGVHEFVVLWPPAHRLPLLDQAAALMRDLREGAG